MSKDISTVAVLGTIALSTTLWNRLQDAVKQTRSVFGDDLKTPSGKITKKAVVGAINEMNEGDRKELMDRLAGDAYNYVTRGEIIDILKEANIARGTLQGRVKKKSPVSDKEEDGKKTEAQEQKEELDKIIEEGLSDILNQNEQMDKQYDQNMTNATTLFNQMDTYIEKKESDAQLEYMAKQKEIEQLKKEVERKKITEKSKRLQINTAKTLGNMTQMMSELSRGQPETQTITPDDGYQTVGKKRGGKPQKGVVPEQFKKSLEAKKAKKVAEFKEMSELAGLATRKNTTTTTETIGGMISKLDSKIDALSEERIGAIRDKIDTKLDPSRKYYKLQLDKKVVDGLIDTIPEGNRQTLGRAIRGVVGTGELKMNDLLSGLVGLEVGLLTTPSAGVFATGIINQVFDMYNINLNTILSQPESPSESPSASTALTGPININIQEEDRVDDTSDQPTTDNKGDNKQRSINRGLHRMVEYARNLRLPTPQEVRDGAITGAVSSAVSAGLSSGSAMSTIASSPAGFRAGGYMGVITAPMLDAFLRTNNITLSPNMKRAIQLLPPAAVASYIGYTPPGAEVSGAGVLSGAGVTESKLTVPQSVIDQTSAELNQKQSGNKIWQPKAISPSTDILNESRQERYADDLEFIAFNYIPPTSEGAQGTVDTNPLKYSQARESSLRYDEAGISVPYLLWNKVNDANEITSQRIEKLAMGVQLPEMIFMDQDNDTTFENVADYQYPNNEPMAIEFLSPYSDFSNVDNFWAINEESILFTVNP